MQASASLSYSTGLMRTFILWIQEPQKLANNPCMQLQRNFRKSANTELNYTNMDHPHRSGKCRGPFFLRQASVFTLRNLVHRGEFTQTQLCPAHLTHPEAPINIVHPSLLQKHMQAVLTLDGVKLATYTSWFALVTPGRPRKSVHAVCTTPSEPTAACE
jgi:hypothetical protein